MYFFCMNIMSNKRINMIISPIIEYMSILMIYTYLYSYNIKCRICNSFKILCFSSKLKKKTTINNRITIYSFIPNLNNMWYNMKEVYKQTVIIKQMDIPKVSKAFYCLKYNVNKNITTWYIYNKFGQWGIKH